MAWDRAGDAPIRPLLGELSFVGGAANWGYKFRYGLFEIDAADAASIARRMLGRVAA